MILFLTVIKLREENVKDSVVGNQILRDNFLYFVIVSVVTNIVVLVINCLGPGFDSIKPLAFPDPTLMTTAMGTQWVFPKAAIHVAQLLTWLNSVYLNLRLYTQRKHAIKTLPTGSSIPLGSEARMVSEIPDCRYNGRAQPGRYTIVKPALQRLRAGCVCR